MFKNFQKKKEDFVCLNCGSSVSGTGYTNHCPECLFSKHVDINPGDRRETCLGVMKPVSCETKKGELAVIHKCLKCSCLKRNKLAKGDSFDAFMRIAENEVF